mgnify:CR=1 FL=1
MSYEIVLCDSFKKAVKQLDKHYPHVKDDMKEIINSIQSNPEQGDVIPGGKGVRKVRVKNSDLRRGKSGSYRVVYYVIGQPKQEIYMLLVYEKSSKEDVKKKELTGLLKAAGLL